MVGRSERSKLKQRELGAPALVAADHVRMGAESAGMWRIGVMMGWEGVSPMSRDGWVVGGRGERGCRGPFTGVTG